MLGSAPPELFVVGFLLMGAPLAVPDAPREQRRRRSFRWQDFQPASGRPSTAPADSWDRPYDEVAPAARANYIAGKITLAELEGKIENALAGKCEVAPAAPVHADALGGPGRITTPYGTMTPEEYALRRRRNAEHRSVGAATDATEYDRWLQTARHENARAVAAMYAMPPMRVGSRPAYTDDIVPVEWVG